MKFVIFGNPIPQARHRVGINKQMYDPQSKLRDDTYWELRSQLLQKNSKLGIPYPTVPFSHCPVSMDIRFFMPIPKSWGKKKQASMDGCHHACKPDLSNMLKFYEDACNALLYDDDAQISQIFMTKSYSREPRTEIIIDRIPAQLQNES